MLGSWDDAYDFLEGGCGMEISSSIGLLEGSNAEVSMERPL